MTCASDVFGWSLTAVLDRERVSIYLHLTVMEDGGMFLRKGVWRSDRDERLTSLRTSWSEWLLTAAMCFKCVNTSGPVMMDKSIPLKTDRQADRQTDRQTDRQANRQTDRQRCSPPWRCVGLALAPPPVPDSHPSEPQHLQHPTAAHLERETERRRQVFDV